MTGRHLGVLREIGKCKCKVEPARRGSFTTYFGIDKDAVMTFNIRISEFSRDSYLQDLSFR